MILLSSLKFGILQDRSDITVLHPCTIGKPLIDSLAVLLGNSNVIHLFIKTLMTFMLLVFCAPFHFFQTIMQLLVYLFCRGAQAAIVVYDITNQDTFGRAKVWVKELQRQASPNIVIALAGNKADLAAKRAVEFEEAKGYAEENGLLFMETSAKTAMNVNDIFLAIGNKYS